MVYDLDALKGNDRIPPPARSLSLERFCEPPIHDGTPPFSLRTRCFLFDARGPRSRQCFSQYPLYSASVALYNGTFVGYNLCEPKVHVWSLAMLAYLLILHTKLS